MFVKSHMNDTDIRILLLIILFILSAPNRPLLILG